MTSFRVFSTVIACLAMSVQASACCLFPMFPTYAPAYGGYGCGYPPYGMGYYGVGYRGVGFAPGGCCAPSCVSSCCSTCSPCSGGSCSSCTPTQVRNKAIPDEISNEKASDGKQEGERTFGSGNRDDQYNGDPDGGIGIDQFGKSNSGTGSTSEQGDQPNRWSPSGEDNDSSNGGTRTPFGQDIPGMNGFGGGNKIPLDGTESGTGGTDATGTGSGNTSGGAAGDATEADDNNGIIDFSANRPPINIPVDEQSEDAADKADETNQSGDDAEANPGTETSSDEFLGTGQDSARRSNQIISRRDSRTSHFHVISGRRLAVETAEPSGRPTMLSSGQKKRSSVRWISVPVPGRKRI